MVKTYRVVWDKVAADQLRAVYLFIRKDSTQNALKILQKPVRYPFNLGRRSQEGFQTIIVWNPFSFTKRPHIPEQSREDDSLVAATAI